MTGHADGPARAATRASASGMVTAEAALVLPVLVAVTVALAWVVALGVAQVRLVDAAREAARLAARDEPAAHVQQAALAAAPDGSVLTVRRAGDSWVAEVSVDVSTDLPLVGSLPSVPLSARAVSAAEPSTRESGAAPMAPTSARLPEAASRAVTAATGPVAGAATGAAIWAATGPSGPAAAAGGPGG